jgi:ABC-2 type transport system ATP-binding protein
MRELLAEGKRRNEVTVGGASPELREALGPMAHITREIGDVLVMEVEGDAAVREVVAKALSEGARLESVTPKRETLEDLFVRRAL